MLKLQYFGRDVKNWLTGKDPDAGKDWRQEEKGTTEDEMVGWHYRLNGHEFEWTLGVGNGQGSLACCSPWGHRVRHDWTEPLCNKSLRGHSKTRGGNRAGQSSWKKQKRAIRSRNGYHTKGASQVALVVKNPPANAGCIKDVGLIPGLGRSPGGGHGNPLQ